MAINREAFIGNYLDETAENLQAVETGILKLKKDPENGEELNTILRALHTIKGSSRMLKFPGMERTAHGMENIFKGIKEQRYGLTSQLIQVVFIGCDLLKQGAKRIRTSGEDAEVQEQYIDASERIYANEPFDMEHLRSIIVEEKAEGGAVAQEAASGEEEKVTPLPTASADQGDYETIRVKLSSVESIMQTMNQIVIKQFQFKQIQEELTNLGKSFQDRMGSLRKTRETLPIYRDFQELQKTISTAKKSFADQIAVIERNIYELQEQLMRLTMLPLELIFGSIPRMAEEVSSMLGKEVDCRITGTDVLLDKAILEKLHDPVIHIVRNSLDHGLETVEERKTLGKEPVGKLEISCSSEGGNINIRIVDDGRGIDHEKVKQQALERKLVSREEMEELSESDIYAFLFSPGFSTKKEVSDLSGRGVGLDIVRHNIQKVKGKITIKSSLGEGTEFLLSLPLSLATVGGFFVVSGDEKFLIPSNFVHKIVRLPREEKVSYYNKEGFKLGGQIIPLYNLASIVGTKPAGGDKHLYVVVVESVGEKIGIVVDAVLQHVHLIYKPLPKNLQKLKLIQGIVFDETYSIIDILFIPEIIKAFKSIKMVDILRGKLAEEKEAKRVLVVDDSLNTREIEKSILELEDFEVETAVDGIDGLEKLKGGHFDLVVSDLEMPRMDGLTMIENIRKDGRYGKIPIIVVSSHHDPEIRKKVLDGGANAFIIKSEFDRNSLSGIARRLT